MKIFSFFVGLALTTAPIMAQTPVENLAPLPVVAAKMATVTPFITGLKEPQGLCFDEKVNLTGVRLRCG